MKTTILKSKQLHSCALALVTALIFASCSQDDHTILAPVINEQEFITTVTALYTPQDDGTAITLQYKDLDGEGANAPIITISSAFQKNKTYHGTVTFKNELANPAQDITAEISEEGVDHQLFYQKTGTLNAFSYGLAPSNFDKNGKPVGLQSVFVTTGEASGNLTITLKHQPNKSAINVVSGDITHAGGSTDAEVSFPISVI